jgi:hypothetical protein
MGQWRRRPFLAALVALLSRRVVVPDAVIRWCRVAAVWPFYFALCTAAGLVGLLLSRLAAYSGIAWNWDPYDLDFGLGLGFLLGPVMLLAAVVDSLYQGWCAGPGEKLDYAYWPRLTKLPTLVRSWRVRILLLSAIACTLAYWAWRAEKGEFLVPDPVVVIVLAVWGILWAADALKRPNMTTFCPALIFLFVTMLLALFVVSEALPGAR